jgi:hypothetical protein
LEYNRSVASGRTLRARDVPWISMPIFAIEVHDGGRFAVLGDQFRA